MNTDTWLVAIICPTQAWSWAMGYGLMVGMVRGYNVMIRAKTKP